MISISHSSIHVLPGSRTVGGPRQGTIAVWVEQGLNILIEQEEIGSTYKLCKGFKANETIGVGYLKSIDKLNNCDLPSFTFPSPFWR